MITVLCVKSFFYFPLFFFVCFFLCFCWFYKYCAFAQTNACQTQPKNQSKMGGHGLYIFFDCFWKIMYFFKNNKNNKKHKNNKNITKTGHNTLNENSNNNNNTNRLKINYNTNTNTNTNSNTNTNTNSRVKTNYKNNDNSFVCKIFFLFSIVFFLCFFVNVVFLRKQIHDKPSTKIQNKIGGHGLYSFFYNNKSPTHYKNIKKTGNKTWPSNSSSNNNTNNVNNFEKRNNINNNDNNSFVSILFFCWLSKYCAFGANKSMTNPAQKIKVKWLGMVYTVF